MWNKTRQGRAEKYSGKDGCIPKRKLKKSWGYCLSSLYQRNRFTEDKKFTYPCTGVGNRTSIQIKLVLKPKLSPSYHKSLWLMKTMAGLTLCLISCPPLCFSVHVATSSFWASIVEYFLYSLDSFQILSFIIISLHDLHAPLGFKLHFSRNNVLFFNFFGDCSQGLGMMC